MAEIHNGLSATRRSGKDREAQQARCHEATRLWQGLTTGSLPPSRQARAERHNRLVAPSHQARAEIDNRLIATRPSGEDREAQQARCHQATRLWQRGTTGSLPPGHLARAERHNTRSAMRRKAREALTICVQPTMTRARLSGWLPLQRS